MCGIAGIVGLARDASLGVDVVDAMLAALAHRGPDSSGSFAADGAALGCRRLRIHDLVAGDQPLFNEDGSLVLVCNGEIFNHAELRRQLLARGHRFRSRTDVEVLLHLYEEQGPDMLAELEGQFAFALFDRRQRRLFAARDRFGVCPLFYTVLGDRLMFASEIKAFAADPLFRPRVDLAGLDQILCFPGLVSPRTMFTGVRSLAPGHRLVVEDGAITTAVYWDLDYPRREDIDSDCDAKELTEELRELLRSSVARRLQAEVPVGVYLSGGLDSAVLAAMADRAATRPPDTFSITFPRPAVDESVHQRLVARSLRGHHRSIAGDDDAILARMQQMIRHAECPVKESYNSCSLMLAEAARAAGVPVVLCGDGADELLFGYPGYRLDARGGRRGSAGLEGALEAEIRGTVFGDPTLFYERGQLEFRDIRRSLYAPALADALDEFDCCRAPLVDPERVRGRHPLHQRSYLDLKLRLADHLLADHGDRMAMAHGVEPRFPFLDLALVDRLRRVPPQVMLAGGVEKACLRAVARGLVPDAIVEREKFGFVAEGSPGLLARRVPWVMDMLAPERIARQGYFNVDTVAALVRRNSRPGFRLALPFEDDLLMVVLSFNLLLDCFKLPDLT